MAKIGYTRKPDGQNRVPPSTLVPGRHLTAQRPPRPDSGQIWNGSTRFWLLIPPSATRLQNFNFVVQSVCDAPIINTSYQQLPFGSGDYRDSSYFNKHCTNFLTYQTEN